MKIYFAGNTVSVKSDRVKFKPVIARLFSYTYIVFDKWAFECLLWWEMGKPKQGDLK